MLSSSPRRSQPIQLVSQAATVKPAAWAGAASALATPLAVRIPGKTVPEGMLKGMQMYGYLGPYQTHPTIGPVLKAIKQVKIEANGLRLSTEP
jgi:hypothetical protein